jgi:hypothetical protein
MLQITQQSGITFAVDEVTPTTHSLPQCRTHEAIKEMLGGAIESCCDYHGTVIKRVHYQPLLAAVYIAFSEHRPLVLSPDAVWITIAQGVAHHMAIHGERLRSRFVAHQGKLDLVVTCSGWVEGSPENPWSDAFASWADQIREHVGSEIHDGLICDFSTTGAVERTASRIVLMDVFERYFHYVLYCICGIPTVTLEGTPGDWQRLLEKAQALRKFDMDWWLDHLLPICEQFVRASRGDVDLPHWQSICKLQDAYGGDIINGWVGKLFPYLRAFSDGPCSRRNPIFDTGEGFRTSSAPPGLSRVPFVWIDGTTGRQRQMEAIGGLIGVQQEPETLALRPKVGWAAREAEKLDVLLARLAADHKTFPAVPDDERPRVLPPDLAKFFHHTEGAEILSQSRVACHIHPATEMNLLAWGEVSDHLRDNDYPNGHIWYRLATLPDGSWLAINPCPDSPQHLREQLGREFYSGGHVAICHCSASTQGKPGKNPVIAISFTELLERLMDGDGQPYWLEGQYVPYGDAEEFTRRK